MRTARLKLEVKTTRPRIIVNLPAKVREAFPNARTISEALGPLGISVAAKDRDTATAYDPLNCALNRACRRSYAIDGAFIGATMAYLLTGTHLTKFSVPITVNREILTFDRHNDFALGNYRLSPVRKSLRIGNAKHRAGKYGKAGSKPRKAVVTTMEKHYTTRVREM